MPGQRKTVIDYYNESMARSAAARDYRKRHGEEYLAIPVELRLRCSRLGLETAERNIGRLKAEIDSGCSTAWLARRQLPYQVKKRDYNLRRIEECENEIMCTRYPEIFSALTEDFGPRQVRTRMQGNKQISWITARTVMNRLDEVLGPENWWDEYPPATGLQNGVLCKLTIRLPDGETITKSDVGGNAGMSDEGDDGKSGFSDAFKRAAVKFGVGRHLYGEGSTRYNFAPTAKSSDKPASAKTLGPPVQKPATNGQPKPSDDPEYRGPQSLQEFYKYLKAVDPEGTNGARNDLIQWGRKQGFPDLVKDWSDAQAKSGYLYLSDKFQDDAE